jgi:DNA polymerase III subunit epsilon
MVQAPVSTKAGQDFDDHKRLHTPLTFVAIDVETANATPSSICQIACVQFEGGIAIDSWQSFVNPLAPFAALNVSLHGISCQRVEHAPTFLEIVPALSARLLNKVVVSHMSFDRRSVQAALAKHGQEHIQCQWLDTAFIARRTWPRFQRRGYGLKSVADWCGIAFSHHNALDDAMAAGQILAQACSHTKRSLDDWFRIAQRTNSAEACVPANALRSLDHADAA